ncbi:hypothetical protein [Duffyella gerundensis]|uniref:hypothetical protein n=1 Tax=Duffyella gerundensis TaxID=1619313 RepID=UPI003FD27F11
MAIKAYVKDKDFDINDIIDEAQPFDIILFNNNIFKIGQFSLTSFLVKIGSNSCFNHAALIMDDDPFHANINSSQAALLICKCRRKHQGRCKYVYEYAASGEPVTYQLLEEKLDSKECTSISLIRFGIFNGKIKKHPSKMTSAKNFLINDFHLRMGCSAQSWKNRIKNNTQKLSYKYTYNTTDIIHRTLLSVAIVDCAAVLISSPLSFYSQIAHNVLFWSLVCLPIIALAIPVMEHFNKKRYKKVIARRAICSGYPPEILSSVMFNPKKQKSKIDSFNLKWTQVTPPTPANLYKNAKSSKGCIIINFKRK